MTVRDLAASVTVSERENIFECVAVEPLTMADFVELVTISKLCMYRGWYLFGSGVII